jgi:hypothetical protein
MYKQIICNYPEFQQKLLYIYGMASGIIGYNCYY